jgi:hypothetical protein
MVTAIPLDVVDESGDKGRGLRELAEASLPIPPTLVVADASDMPQDEVLHGPDAIFAHLGLDREAKLIVRPSLRIQRDDAAGVSGLYPSLPASYDQLEATIAAAGEHHGTADRIAEGALLGAARASTAMFLLLQPMLDPAWSGVAHVVRCDEPGYPAKVDCGIVAGHLSGLVDGTAEGWQCEITEVDVSGLTDVAVVADEEALVNILALTGARDRILELFEGVRRLRAFCRGDREVEWAVQDGQVTFLQSQPLTMGQM